MAKTKKNQTKKIVQAGKDLVASKAESLNKKLYKMIDQGITELTLNLVNVKSIDPVGLSVIAATHNTMNNAGGKLVLKKIPDDINTIFNSLGLNKHLNIEQMKKNV